MSALLFGAYALVGTAMVPALLSLSAALDGSHEVCVELSESGARLTLVHQVGQFTPAVSDHQNSTSRALVSLCRNDREGNHEFNAAHLSSRSLVNRDVEIRASIDLQPSLNLAASLRHQDAIAFCFAPVGGFSSCLWRNFNAPPLASPLPMMATVQLLI